MNTGKVFLIGAGPGAIDLLTLRAVRSIGLAEVILIDDLVNPEVLQFARASVHAIIRMRSKNITGCIRKWSIMCNCRRRGLRPR